MQFCLFASVAVLMAPGVCLAQYTITTFAGTGTCCASPDGVPATSAYLQGAYGLVFDKAGNLYIWETQPSRIRKVNSSGVISSVAGVDKNPGYSGDGGPALSAQLLASTQHAGLAWDSQGNLYISDGGNNRIRRVAPDGKITTVAGTGVAGFGGDGGPAVQALLYAPTGIAVDSMDNLYIADHFNSRVRKVTPNGVITTVAGNGNVQPAGDGGPATSASFRQPRSVAVDAGGNLYISDGTRIRKVNASGVISTVAGTGVQGFSGDGGPAVNAQLAAASGMAIDSGGNLFIADTSNQRVRKVDAAGIITTIAGATAGFSGDGGPSTGAQLRVPHDVVLDAAGNLYVSDTGNFRIRRLSPSGIRLSADPAQVSFSYATGGGAPAPQKVRINSSGGAQNFSVAVSSQGNWLSANPTAGTTPSDLQLAVNPAGLGRGIYQGSVLITPASASVAPLTFAVTLTVTGADLPAITSLVNASGYQPKLAPGALFKLSGQGLGGEPAAVATAPDYPSVLAGSSVSFVSADGNVFDARILSAGGDQIIGFLPSTVPPGDFKVNATYNGLASTPANVTVVPRSFGMDSISGIGTGPAKATLENVNGGLSQVRFTSGTLLLADQQWTLGPAHPGDTVVLTGTGGGPDPANDAGDTSGDQSGSASFAVILGGREVPASFAAAVAGYPGAWTLKFTVPDDMAPGCFTPLAVRADGEQGNQTTLAIAAPGEDACAHPQLSRQSLSVFDAGGTITLGGFGVSKYVSTTSIIPAPGAPVTVIPGTQEIIGGSIGRFTAAAYAATLDGQDFGPCRRKDTTVTAGSKPPFAPESYLDAGASIPASGPGLAAGSALGIAAAGPVYALVMKDGVIAGGGVYTLSGTGGADLGAFEASVPFPESFRASNWDAISTIDRSQPLTLTWEGSGFDEVEIIISTSRVLGKDKSNNNIVRAVSIACQVPAGPGSHTIPPDALAGLLPESIDAASMANGAGLLSIQGQNIRPFTAPLAAGGATDYAAFSAVLGVSKNLVVQ